RSRSASTPAGPRRLLRAGPGGIRRERDALGAVAAEGVAEGRECLLVERAADRNVSDAEVVVAVVLRRVARPRAERDLLAEAGDGRAHHPLGLLLVEGLELVDRRARHPGPPPDDDGAVLLVVYVLSGIDGLPVEAPHCPEPVVRTRRRRERAPQVVRRRRQGRHVGVVVGRVLLRRLRRP